MKIVKIILIIGIVLFLFPKQYRETEFSNIDDKTSPTAQLRNTCIGLKTNNLCFGWITSDLIN